MTQRPIPHRALAHYAQEYERLKASLNSVGYVLQGSLIERRMVCGKSTCHCHTDARARHGPYFQWSWKTRAKTCSVYLDAEQAELCRRWITSNRLLERTVRRLRAISLTVAKLHGLPHP